MSEESTPKVDDNHNEADHDTIPSVTVSNIFEVISKGEPGNITNDTGLDDVIVTEHMIQENIEKVDAAGEAIKICTRPSSFKICWWRSETKPG